MKKHILFLMLVLCACAVSCSDTLSEIYDGGNAYNLRDTGPAGGIIFYINPDFANDGWRYLEAAPVSTEWVSVNWSPSMGYNSTAAQRTEIGAGEENTAAIVSVLNAGGAVNLAAQRCSDLSYGGYDDWFLPSRDELDAMRNNLQKSGAGSFADNVYWSSSEDASNANSAWIENFTVIAIEYQVAITKWQGCYVRAIRMF